MTDAELHAYAVEIFEDLRQYGPRDASSIITYINWLIIKEAFSPEDGKAALAAIDAEANLLRKFIQEGWQ